MTDLNKVAFPTALATLSSTRKVMVQPFLFCGTTDAFTSPLSILFQSCHTSKPAEFGAIPVSDDAAIHRKVVCRATPKSRPEKHGIFGNYHTNSDTIPNCCLTYHINRSHSA